MPLLWLRVAVLLYGLGLVYALVTLLGRREWLGGITIHAVSTAMVFHMVSLVETMAVTGHVSPVTLHEVESLAAFCLMVVFMVFYLRYQTMSPGIFVFPLVFLLALSAAVGQRPPHFNSSLLRSGWLLVHIALILTGYAALFFSVVASLLYLLQEHSLKQKQMGMLSRLPPLQVIDDIGYRSLLLGFPFMTLGLIAGSVLAQAEFGAAWISDPKVVLSLVMWAVYMVLIYTRWSAGWRGRKAAMLATFTFLIALGTWAANYVSFHRFLTTP